ncbi:MAG: aminopeptidase P family protein [Lachnospiraceae bacterium]|nr:aminopeptidase P family protein [Lachnospiraceae bacterium]
MKGRKMGTEHRKRIERLRECMRRDGVDQYIVPTADPHMSEYICDHYKFREYLSGFSGSAGTLLVGMEEAILWTDGRYYIQAEKELEGSGVKLYRMQDEGVPGIFDYLYKHAFDKVIGADREVMSEDFYEELCDVTEDESNIKDIDYAKEIWEDRPKRRSEEVIVLSEEISGRSVKDKIEDIINRISDNSADILFLTDLSDIMWTFNIRGNDIEYNPVAYSYAIISRNEVILFIDDTALCGKCKRMIRDNGYGIRAYEDVYSFAQALKDKDVILDCKAVNTRLYLDILENNRIYDIDHTEIIRKAVKNETEIELSRKYHLEDGRALIRWIYDIKRIVKERRIDEYEAAMLINSYRSRIDGYRDESFATICAYGENAAIVHYEPHKDNSAILKPEGFVLLDSGGQYMGATTDITRTVALGELTDEMKQAYTVVLKGHLRLMSAIFLKGCRGENLDICARGPIWERFLDYKHGTGHGVGSFLNVHEGPQAFRYHIREGAPQPVMEPGMITSDEPGLYIEGKYGIRIENLLLCTEKHKNEYGTFLGFEPLSLVPFEREAIIREELNSDELKTLNSYHEAVYESYKDLLSENLKEWLREATAKI